MLKRLELVGFKSFADKTAFDFAPGVTGIVGPNGSGKSNIVDSVRWVLGEQSAKSLRGGEMADVIFNGSASRRSLGMAEVTMTFDNSRHVLATPAEEVQIARRVYRGGEGEYLINNQVCRLKDIKDLFLGSGAGSDAYCIIEQGRVDVLLQASTKDRRTIFEEAAGISRFKAKKIETLRRLERVDQNVARLRDILDEVEKQLRSVKLQAAKAQRYQEYSQRLRELRVALGLREFHQLSQQLQEETAILERMRAELSEQMAQADAWEKELHQLEDSLSQLDGSIREQAAALASAREQIASQEATLAHEWTLADDIDKELARVRQRRLELSRHVVVLAELSGRVGDELRQVETACQSQRQDVQEREQQLQATEARLSELRQQVQREENEHIERMRQSGRFKNDAISFKAQVDNLTRERMRLLHRSEQAAEHLASLDVELQELSAAEDELQARLGSARQALTDLRQERDRMRQVRDATTQRAADLREQRSGLLSRIEVLEGLERSHEGLGTGPRELFALLEQPDPGPWRTVLGILAEFLTVRREFAPLIDLALGERAQRFLVRDPDQLAQALRQRKQPFSSRVSFLPLTVGPASRRSEPRTGEAPVPPMLLASGKGPLPIKGVPPHPGIIALAEQVVRCDNPELADLPVQLLAGTLIVHDLTAARTLAPQLPGHRFVTLRGELLEADGTLTIGTHHAETGILSRRSELRELREQVVDLDRRLTDLDRDLLDLREALALLDSRAENGQQEIDVLSEQVSDLRSRIGQHRQRREGLHEEVQVSRSEISDLERDIERLTQSWQQARDQAARADAEVQHLHSRLEDAKSEIREHESHRQERQQEAMSARVALAQVEERLSALRARHAQIEADLHQRHREREQAQRQQTVTLLRRQENQRTMLEASSSLAICYVCKEASERQLAEWGRERARLNQERQQLTEQAQASRATWRSQQEQAHARELTVSDLRHRRDALCTRLSEDYQIDLAALYEKSEIRNPKSEGNQEDKEENPRTAEEVISDLPVEDGLSPEQEIEELRRKLNRLGSVNLDALQELADLEARAGALHLQYDDLTSAQKALQEIIAKINGDSRKLFSETFAVIRAHFQELFRKLFGGGMADIVLEDENDILESGIEVIARPPGKELRSISLMSGGEKTMTAVALLLAIFRSKPSPFCILDEVDAALDEANIGRFTSVLKDFLDRSQFIIITHSKRTMACADMLYGITMQESGISRRFAVRFEDWPDDEKQEAQAESA
ncbi:MAG TPA: chromosome segregation protein SMC [Gemmataceae bacterium]|nr:chromosome segregation protein SMC [Gemmataceae bacterium]